MSRLAPAGFALAATLLTAAPASAIDNVFQVRDQFIVAGAAAKACGTDDPAQLARYGGNFMLVMARAWESLRVRHPDLPARELEARHRAHIDRLRRLTIVLVRDKGCGDARVQQLLILHALHEVWPLFGPLHQGAWQSSL